MSIITQAPTKSTMVEGGFHQVSARFMFGDRDLGLFGVFGNYPVFQLTWNMDPEHQWS